MHIKGPFKQHAPGYLAERVARVDRYTEVLHTSRNIMLHRPCAIIIPRDAEQKIEILLRGIQERTNLSVLRIYFMRV